MSAAERRVLHETIANVIQEPEERARHLILAAVGPDEKIAHQVEIAARHAEGRGAPEAAATLLEHARTLTPNAHARVAARRGLAAADAFFRAGELPSAEALLTEMLGSASGGRSRADLLFRLAAIRGRAFNFPEAHRLLAEAAAEAGEDRRLRSVIEQELGLLMMMNGNVPKALAHARAAFELASGVDAGLEASSALWVAAFEFIMGGGLPEEAKARLQALEAEPGPSLIGATPWGEPRFFLAFVSKASDDFAGARTRLRHLCRIAADRGDEGVLPFYLCQLSELEFWNGRWDEAERYASEGLRFADLSEQAAVVPVLRYCSALVDAGRGRIDRARRAAELANGGAETTGNLPVIAMARSALGFIDLSLGDYAAAHASMGPVAELLASMGTGEPGLLRVFADEIEALVGLGELDKAGFLVDYLEERGRTLDRPWALATGARSRALLLSALGDLGSASESLDQALAEHERLAMPLELGRTHLVRGAVERRAKRKGNARESLSTAIGLFEELGAPLWARKARTELARVGSRPATPFELTPSERRVAELVAAGKTNREVANTLFISVKTVDSNLTRIYRKLGVRSRTELVGAILTASEAASRE
jgi:DNA-binding CsgD family transcriptional regulator